jgi:hypothetical protein
MRHQPPLIYVDGAMDRHHVLDLFDCELNTARIRVSPAFTLLDCTTGATRGNLMGGGDHQRLDDRQVTGCTQSVRSCRRCGGELLTAARAESL